MPVIIHPMNKLLRSPRFPFAFTLILSLSLVGGGTYFSQVMRLAACPLCIVQRMLYLCLGVAALLGLLAAKSRWGRRFMALLMAAIAGTGVFVAGYQTWLQRWARDVSCTNDYPWWEQAVDWAGARWPMLFQPNGLCSDPAWKFLSLSIAEWSLVMFSSLLLLSVYTALRKAR